jgi:hypothetical protein
VVKLPETIITGLERKSLISCDKESVELLRKLGSNLTAEILAADTTLESETN